MQDINHFLRRRPLRSAALRRRPPAAGSCGNNTRRKDSFCLAARLRLRLHAARERRSLRGIILVLINY